MRKYSILKILCNYKSKIYAVKDLLDYLKICCFKFECYILARSREIICGIILCWSVLTFIMVIAYIMICCWSLSHVQLFCEPMDRVAHQAPLTMECPSRNTGVGCHFLLQWLAHLKFFIRGSDRSEIFLSWWVLGIYYPDCCPDTEEFWVTRSHKEIMAMLVYYWHIG